MSDDRYITITVAYEPGKRPPLEWAAPELKDAGLALLEEHDEPRPSRTWGGVVDEATFQRFARAWHLPDQPTENGYQGAQSYTFDGLNWETGGHSPIVYVTVRVVSPTRPGSGRAANRQKSYADSRKHAATALSDRRHGGKTCWSVDCLGLVPGLRGASRRVDPRVDMRRIIPADDAAPGSYLGSPRSRGRLAMTVDTPRVAQLQCRAETPAVRSATATVDSNTTDKLHQALSRPASYPDRPAQVEVRETHISSVFLAGELAYKLKKPLVLDFLDYGTPARRRAMCEEEVRLNRRLAPDIYLGVRGVAVIGDRAELTAPDDPRAVDFVVEMRRYDERHTLAERLDRGELNRDHVRAVGGVLARFHADTRRIPDAAAPVLAVERRFERNLHELLACVEQRVEIGRVLALERFAHAFISARARTLQARAAGGWVREGHGDLRAEHVLVDGGVRIVDCVEFDCTLRELDVADDLAFLVFDLAAHGGERFGGLLVQAYREAGGDPGDNALISFYAAYRALVRAKISLVRAAQLPPRSAQHGEASAHARDLILLAERFAWRARLPLLVVVCGVPASGKSHLAGALAQRSGLPHLSSDVTRKRLGGRRASERAPAESYSAAWNTRTYTELARRAKRALATNGGAIVDATFRHLADRQAFSSALGAAPPLLFVECQAPRRVLAERASRRERDPGRVSDAGAAVVMRELESWEALDEVAPGTHLALRTDRPLEQIVADVLALLDDRLQVLPWTRPSASGGRGRHQQRRGA